MNAHRMRLLGVVAAVALGAALWSSQTRKPAQEDVAAGPVVAGLQAGLNDVTALRIRTAGDVLQATIERTADGWVLVERGRWPVDANLLRDYLLKLANAKRVEAKTTTPASYYKIGVEDIATRDTPGTQVEIDGLAQPVRLIVGRNVQRGSGTYVRHVGDAQSWEADTDLAIERAPGNWLQRELVDIDPRRVTRVQVTPAAGAAIDIVRAADDATGTFALARVPKGREASAEFVADATAGVLSGLRFDDVLSGADAAPPATGVTAAQFDTEEGIVIALRAWKAGEATHAQLHATLDEEIAARHVEQAQARAAREFEATKAAAAAPSAIKGTAPDAATPVATSAASAPPPADAATADETASPAAATDAATGVDAAPPLATTDPAADRTKRLAALRDEVAAMNARFDDHAFVLPPYKASNLDKPLDAYLKPVP